METWTVSNIANALVTGHGSNITEGANRARLSLQNRDLEARFDGWLANRFGIGC